MKYEFYGEEIGKKRIGKVTGLSESCIKYEIDGEILYRHFGHLYTFLNMLHQLSKLSKKEIVKLDKESKSGEELAEKLGIIGKEVCEEIIEVRFSVRLNKVFTSRRVYPL